MMDYIRQFQLARRRSLSGPCSDRRVRPVGRRLRRGSFEVELLERRELLATVQNFDVPGTGTQFAPLQAGNAPGPAVIQLSPTNGVMQLTSGLASTPNQDNSIS